MKKSVSLSVGILLSLSAIAETYVINVDLPTDVATVQTAISDAVAAENTDITLLFASGKEFFGGTDVLTVPAGVTALSLQAENNSSTKVNLKSLTLSGIYSTLSIENLYLSTTSTSTNLIGQTATSYPLALNVKRCTLEGYRGIFNAAGGQKISILFDNCLFQKIGSYGLVNGGANLGSATFTNCTFFNLTTVFNNSSWVIDANNPFTLSNCTFFNKGNLTENTITNGFFRPSANPSAGAFIDKNIVASTTANANGLMYSSSGYSGLNFATSFKTNTYTAAKLNGIQTFDGSAETLFVDPDNKDFSFHSGISGDILQAGDPTRNRKPIPLSVQSTEKPIRTLILNDCIEVEGQEVSTQIFDISGQLQIESRLNLVSTSSLRTGLYVVKITTDGQSLSEKLCIGTIER